MCLDRARNSRRLAIVQRSGAHPLEKRFRIMERWIENEPAARVLIIRRGHENFHEKSVARGRRQFEGFFPLHHVSISEHIEIGKVMHRD